MKIDEIKFDRNMDWMYDLLRNETRQDYLRQLSEPSNVALMSVSRFQMVDSYLGCWLLVNVDSYEVDPNTLRLVQSLARHFHEKCSVGVVDVSYPANFDLLKPIVSENTPTIILKRRFKLC